MKNDAACSFRADAKMIKDLDRISKKTKITRSKLIIIAVEKFLERFKAENE